jgi:exopolysaccharide biosynthesis polyprenyl glycosylphosphotransferase
MVQNVLPKKSVLLFVGDISIISMAYLAASAVLIGSFDMHRIITPGRGMLFLSAHLFTFYLIDFYNGELKFKCLKYVLRHVMGAVTAAGLIATVFYLFPALKTGREIFVAGALMTGAGTYAWRLAYLGIFNQELADRKNLLIIGAGKAGTTLYHVLRENPDYKVIGLLTDDGVPVWGATPVPMMTGNAATLKRVMQEHNVNTIVLAGSHYQDTELLKSALNCKLHGVSIYDMPSFYERVTGKVPVEHVTDFWLVFTPLLGVKKSAYNVRVKRALDLVLAFFGLVINLPLAAAIALAIKLDSAGPVLYQQPRVGLNGKRFTLFKFRSMTTGTDKERKFAGQRNDPRITRVGRIIRLSRLDEVPQMWNVLKGDMSFIGPRALIEDEVREFEAQIPYFSLRHSVRPGITGWAQVRYKHGARVEDGLEKLQYDLFYIKNLSPFLDLHILLSTVKVVLLGKGAR